MIRNYLKDGMVSLVKYAQIFDLTYSVDGYETCCGTSPQNALIDNDVSFYDTASKPNSWWQISFSKNVSIKSYILRSTKNISYCPKSWIINVSFDKINWRTVDKVELEDDVSGEKNYFKLKKSIKCMHFRIVILTNSVPGRSEIKFTFFDCFYKSPLIQKCYTQYFSYLNYKLFIDVIISSLSIIYI